MTGVLAVMAGGRGFLPLAVAASNVSRRIVSSDASGTVTTLFIPSTTITGGVAPYTQEWTRLSGDTPTVSDSTALNPTWSATVFDGVPNASVWRCTVTDAVSAVATTDITVTLTWVEST